MQAPFELAGYEILEKIGEGGMSSVWKARQLSLDRLVAIKTLAASYLPDGEALARFRLEAQAAARLNHPGIVQVYDAGESGGVPYLVMEFVEGCTAAVLLERNRRLTEKNALLIAEGVASALGYAWDKDCIIHCDVKPDNVLVRPDGAIKVTDLGLARFIGLHRRRLDEETVLGTPNYTSPEQAQGLPDLDCRTDIYALGAMLYHLATGVMPFAGSPGSSAMDRHIHEFLPDPLEHHPELSQPMAWLIEKLMVKDRAYRPPYWSTVLADIQEVKEGRFPLEPLPQPGQSTVTRSAARIAALPKPAVRTVRVAAAETTPRKRLVVAKGELEEAAAAAKTSSSGVGRSLFTLVILLLLAAAVYAFFRLGVAERIRLRPPPASPVEKLPPVAPVEPVTEEAPVAPSPPDEEPVAVEWGEEPVPESGMKDGRVVWQNADFLRGAALYNEALAAYEGFQKTRQNPAVLSRAETQARDAIKAFEACRSLAPPDVDVPGFINNCYHLIADVRHSTLLQPPAAGKRPAHTASEFPAPPAATASPGTPDAAAVPPAGLVLSPLWNKSPLGPRPLWADLKELLAPHGAPAVVRDADPTLEIIPHVRYLMPVREAAEALRSGALSVKRSLDCPGFPDRSFSYYELRGSFGQDFDRLLLVVDAADQVVAVQLVSSKPLAARLDATFVSDRWLAYNFVESRVKMNRQWRVAHRVRLLGRIVAVDSELLAGSDQGEAPAGRARERVTLFLPEPIVNLILARLDKAS